MASQNLPGGIFDDNVGLVPNSEGGYIPIVITDVEQESRLKSIGQLQLYWIRFRKHRLALVGGFTIVALILMAICAPLITPGVGPTTIPFLQLNVPLFGPSHPPSLDNFPWRLFGTTTQLNYSILAQITYGARLSLTISFVAALLTSFIGTVMGAISGFFGGWIDILIMRVTDVFLSIPLLPLLIAISAIYHGGGWQSLIIILSALSWPGLARLVRSIFLSLREAEFAEAARAVGVNRWRIIFRHLLPNALSPVVVSMTLLTATFVTLEATLDFLGLGVQFPPTITWGNILSFAQDDLLAGDWWWAFFPGLFLVITVLSVNFIGDGLRDALDVRTRIE
jgi:peptide/nickel transport system permease protein